MLELGPNMVCHLGLKIFLFSVQGNYAPSYLVCPETYNWIPIEQCCPKLDLSKYSRLDDSDEGENCKKLGVSDKGKLTQ